MPVAQNNHNEFSVSIMFFLMILIMFLVGFLVFFLWLSIKQILYLFQHGHLATFWAVFVAQARPTTFLDLSGSKEWEFA